MRTSHVSLRRLLVGLVALGLLVFPTSVLGSSHREAPLISTDPTADNTDVYAFVSPDKPDTVTLVADYIPLEDPAGGPNFYAFDDKVLYAIHVDNNGDGKDDVTYQFRFQTVTKNPNTFLYNTGQLTTQGDPDWNRQQSYSVTRVMGGTSTLLDHFDPTTPVNIGPRSTPNYAMLEQKNINGLSNGGLAFVGQRDDPFFVDTGSIFDLAGLRPFNAAHLIPLGTAPGVDGLGGFNTHSIIIRVPITEVTSNHKMNPATARAATIGVWASASRQTQRVLKPDGSQATSGAWQQVSRLGNPLINEVVIPLGAKDYWNSQPPYADKQFAKYYTSPEVAGLINLLYPSLPDVATTNRTDLAQILLTGVPGLNNTGTVQSDMLRLNTGIAPCTADSATDTVGKCSRLGVLSGDLAGFPNGRRLSDDVTDIELRAIAQGYGTFLATNFGLPNKSPNKLVGDGVNTNDMAFNAHFPYVASPFQGYNHTHHKVGSTDTGFLP